MSEHRFFNPHQPQTLQTAVLLLYLTAALQLISAFGFIGPLGLAFIAALAGGAYGIANERRWGYALAVGATGLAVLWLVAAAGFAVLQFPVVITFIFQVGLFGLLVHPQSRDYQRVWFR